MSAFLNSRAPRALLSPGSAVEEATAVRPQARPG